MPETVNDPQTGESFEAQVCGLRIERGTFIVGTVKRPEEADLKVEWVPATQTWRVMHE